MRTKKSAPEPEPIDPQVKLEEERQQLVVQVVKLPNGATFTRLRPVGQA